MNTSGEAADQIVKMSLNGAEVALRISGVAAKEVAIMLYSLLKDNQKSKGRTRLENLVKSGKPLTIYTVSKEDYEQFKSEAKRYGILYCSIKNGKDDTDGMIDIMVKQEDASRIDRIVERFKFSDVSETAQVKSDIIQSRESKKQKQEVINERPVSDKNDELIEQLLTMNPNKEKNTLNPDLAKMAKSRPSEPISKKDAGDPEKLPKPSVRKELNEIKVQKDKEAKQIKNPKTVEHVQPIKKRKKKER